MKIWVNSIWMTSFKKMKGNNIVQSYLSPPDQKYYLRRWNGKSVAMMMLANCFAKSWDTHTQFSGADGAIKSQTPSLICQEEKVLCLYSTLYLVARYQEKNNSAFSSLDVCAHCLIRFTCPIPCLRMSEWLLLYDGDDRQITPVICQHIQITEICSFWSVLEHEKNILKKQ